MEVNENNVYLQPLHSEQIRNIIALKNTYGEFWENVRFTKGWASPICEKDEVMHLLESAAEIVVRVRTHLDFINPEPKFRILDGNAKEYLWNLENLPSEEDFIRQLVHATLKQGNGYVEDLTKDRVDKYIDEVHEYNIKNHGTKLALEGSLLEDQLLKVWNEADVLLKSTLIKDDDKYWNEYLIQDLQQLLKQVTGFQRRLQLIGKKREFCTKVGTPQTPESKIIYKSKQTKQESTDIETTPPEEPTTEQKPVEQKPVEQKPAEQKPAEQKLAEQKPAEQKPAEQKPAEQKPAEQKPAEQKPAEQKPAEQKPVEKKPTEEKKPAPVPEQEEKTPQEQKKNEPPKVERNADEEGILKIKTLAKEVVGIEEEIQSVSKAAESLKELLSQNPDEALQTIQTLKANCVKNSTNLMQDLLKLDELVGLHSGRELKKKEVTHIQQLMDEVEDIKRSLNNFEIEAQDFRRKKGASDLEKIAEEELERLEKLETQHATPKENTSGPKQSAPGNSTPNQTASEPSTLQLSSLEPENLRDTWQYLKLYPRIQIDQTRDKYIISANIPGMQQEDIEVAYNPHENTIMIQGVRIPSEEEETNMRKQVRARFRPRNLEEENELVLRFGAGRFGKFKKEWKLPPRTDASKINGSYKEGILLVQIPKVPEVDHDIFPSIPFRHLGYGSPLYRDPSLFW